MSSQVSSPNFLVLISDEHRKDAMGCVGHPIVQTPHLDALALNGTIFENAYTPSPMCVPTRASLACGDYVHKIGHWDSASPYDGKHPSWMHQLRGNGINTTSIGKLHFRSSDDDNGFTKEILPMHVVDGVGWAIGLLRERPPTYDSARELAADIGSGSSTYTDYDIAITKAAEDWIHAQATHSQPWAAFVSLVSPHYPLIAPKEFYDLYDPRDIDLPIAYAESQRPKHPELNNISNFFNYDDYFDEDKVRKAKVAYYGLTSFMDDCVGRILKALENSKQADNTVIIYVSDHGEMLGDHGLWTKQVMYESSAGVPMIAKGPGVPVGHRVKTGASLLDIAPTALDVMGVDPSLESTKLPGISLRNLATSPDNSDRTLFSEYHDGGSSTASYMIRWEDWKYVHYAGYPPQLFNLAQDANECRDLASDAAVNEDIRTALYEGEKRLRNICDPDKVNQQCFVDQKKRIEDLGGEQACQDAFVFNHTPAPT